MNLRSHAKNLRKAMLRRYRDLDGLAVLTDQDRAEYERAMNGTAPPMWRIPNTVARDRAAARGPERQADLRRRPLHAPEGLRLS